MGIFAAGGVLLPFPYYYWLWTNPQAWVNFCGKDKDPSKVMAYVSHFLKLLQFISLFSVSTLSWPPPLYFWPLFGFGQFLNFSLIAIPLALFMLNLMLISGYLYRDTRYPEVYQLLGEAGTYYGVRFGKNVPWVTEFPFRGYKRSTICWKRYESLCMSILGPFPLHSLVDSGLRIHNPYGIKGGSSDTSKADLLITNMATLPSNDFQ
ncbi:hypothetical protein OIU78_013304 [Salix suchowensis]|nr:hypothetical protein OIU78_013304 [Salix suchowensis]